MGKMFSEKYADLLTDANFLAFEYKVIKKLSKIIYDFDEPSITYPNKFDYTYTGTKKALVTAVEIFYEHKDWDNEDTHYVIDNLENRGIDELFDISELLYFELSEGYRLAFQKEINDLFTSMEIPWIFVEGAFIKIDSSQFDQDLKNKAVEVFERVIQVEPLFSNAFSEYSKSLELLTQGEYNDATFYASKSFESTLKIIIGNAETNDSLPKNLLIHYKESDKFSSIPAIMNAQGFCDKVLASLFFIRSNSSASHGLGNKESDISKNMCSLAIDIAASLSTFVINEYIEKKYTEIAGELIDIDSNDLPF